MRHRLEFAPDPDPDPVERLGQAAKSFIDEMETMGVAVRQAGEKFERLGVALWRFLLDENFGPT